MYLEKEKSNFAQFLINNAQKKGTVWGYGINLIGKFNEIILFNYKEVYIIKIRLIHLYPNLDDPRINVGSTYFEIDGVEIEKDLLMKAIEWRREKLNF